jgi:hypothetical protein
MSIRIDSAIFSLNLITLVSKITNTNEQKMKKHITYRTAAIMLSCVLILAGTAWVFAETPSPSPENSVTEASPQPADDHLEAGDIADLLSHKKIQVQTAGSGIQNVDIRIKRRVAFPITVRIPVGTFFVSGDQSSQSMVATEEREVTLNSDDWEAVTISTACANRERHIPEGRDSFGILRSPNQKALAKLMPALEKADVDYQTRQAAVWIVTDNADYNDLGILVGSWNGVGGSRVINEAEAARAMKICAEAGIDIEHKAIWDDRRRILHGLQDEELRKWLQRQ